MTLLIDSKELELLLEQHRSEIGIHNVSEQVVNAIIFLSSVLVAEYHDFIFIDGNVFKSFWIIIALVILYRGGVLVIKSREACTVESLTQDIENMNQITHPFSILAIKDSFQPHANRFLLYYDARWDCRLFENCKTTEDNENHIVEYISNHLKVDSKNISVEIKGEKVHQKYSVSDQITKMYDHKIYLVTIDNIEEKYQQDSFEIEGRQYCWMSIAQMEADVDIMEKNSDVVAMIKEFVA